MAREERGSLAGAAHSPRCRGWWRSGRAGCWAPAEAGRLQGAWGRWKGLRDGERRRGGKTGGRAQYPLASGRQRRVLPIAVAESRDARRGGTCTQQQAQQQEQGSTSRCARRSAARLPHTHRSAEPGVAWLHPELQPRLLWPGRQRACRQRRAGRRHCCEAGPGTIHRMGARGMNRQAVRRRSAGPAGPS